MPAQDESEAIFAEFKRFFEDPEISKVWHNYSFDRHVLGNMGIDCKGFQGDTMHMARMWDASRRWTGDGGYSLESLTT
jgi:DNA polymerase-1